MAVDYIPSSDADFDNWLNTFSTFCTTSGVAAGLTAPQAADLATAYTAWHSAYQGHLTQQNSAKAATQNKNAERTDAEDIARQLARILQSSPTFADAGRAAAGLTVPDATPTGQNNLSVEATLPPMMLLDWSQRSRVTIKFGTNPVDQHNNGLPGGMRGVKLWFAIGGIPATEAGWQFLVDDTRSPYVHVLTITQPTTIAYRAQYFDRLMHVGPFGDPVIATVTVCTPSQPSPYQGEGVLTPPPVFRGR